jgi:hypothetical protein
MRKTPHHTPSFLLQLGDMIIQFVQKLLLITSLFAPTLVKVVAVMQVLNMCRLMMGATEGWP